MDLGGRDANDNPLMVQFFEWDTIGTEKISWWSHFRREAPVLAEMGFTQVWLPPPNKAMNPKGRGYDAYDLWDLGEFHQKGTTSTRWGTKNELLHAIRVSKELGMNVIIDAVLNHKLGADRKERFSVVEVDPNDRTIAIGSLKQIEASTPGWTAYDFPGRGDKYSTMKWTQEHFTGLSYDAKARKNGVYRIEGNGHKGWSERVSKELGNYDYLLGEDIDHRHPAVKKDLFNWGSWILSETGGAGFRLDACKHFDQRFAYDFIEAVRTNTGKKNLFAVGEYWSGNAKEVKAFMNKFDGKAGLALFDAPLHYNFHNASVMKDKSDLRSIFRGSLVQMRPHHTVTFVENHESSMLVTGQSLQSEVAREFKLIAYALILLRPEGYPCVYHGDLYGPKAITMLPKLIQARRRFAYGRLGDYMLGPSPNCIGFVRMGDKHHPKGCAVTLCNGGAKIGTVRMYMGKENAGTIWRDWMGRAEDVTIDAGGWGAFEAAYDVSVFVNQ
ncbi:glycoside hydrolase family 13 protein [Botryobasidium botryosum FD-172 SS1]|uniref:Glycoside hydrolase family 13 protein n=1 Tax=Botryobasidium botryosum (strain FD-172 SS1) TaxID=930990 RepID=A0A067MWN7_BOTB1|nr:glycoside hydrolase family 13 protein [Botryobasidium botryosum FD-172 SS1]